MNRRSILRLLGLAPMAAPIVAAAASGKFSMTVRAPRSAGMFWDPRENTLWIGSPERLAALKAEGKIRVAQDEKLARDLNALIPS